MKREALIVYITLDPIAPGAFHTQESALTNLQRVLGNSLAKYNPVVMYGPNSAQVELEPPRNAYVVYVDDVKINTKESAQTIVRKVLRYEIGHYNPLVTRASSAMRTTNHEGYN